MEPKYGMSDDQEQRFFRLCDNLRSLGYWVYSEYSSDSASLECTQENWDMITGLVNNLPAIITALRATEPAQVGDADRAFELWFFRDIVDDQRSKLIALMLGGAVAKEATNHGTQRLCLKYILKALRTQGRAADQRCAELEAENARLRSELDAASDVILLAVKNAPDWAHLARAFHERRKALENRDG